MRRIDASRGPEAVLGHWAATQGELWGAAADDWAELQEPLGKPLWGALLDETMVGKGTRFLDAGCGTAGACVMAAERGARVSGLDAAAELIAIARRRVSSGDFRVGDLEALPYEDGSFDAIIASNSVQYALEPVRALRELRRVSGERGLVAVLIWGSPERCDQFHVVEAMRAALPELTGGRATFAISAPGALEALMSEAGLRVVAGGELDCDFAYPDVETARRALASTGNQQAALRAVGSARLRAAMLLALEPFRSAAGGVVLKNRFRYLIGVRLAESAVTPGQL